ncbi:MAG: glucose-6-phosphate isomerase, partial [Oscillospiraceae bacterium]
MSVCMNTKYLSRYVREEEFANLFPQVLAAHDLLHKKQGPGSDFLGWVDLPGKYDKQEFERIKKAAAKIQGNSDLLVVIGIGGSYLGARAVIEAVKSANYNATCKGTPQIYFAGNSVSPSALQDIVNICEGKDFSVNIISKSGTTTEPAIAFRIFKNLLETKYGKKGAQERIFATTDK